MPNVIHNFQYNKYYFLMALVFLDIFLFRNTLSSGMFLSVDFTSHLLFTNETHLSLVDDHNGLGQYNFFTETIAAYDIFFLIVKYFFGKYTSICMILFTLLYFQISYTLFIKSLLDNTLEKEISRYFNFFAIFLAILFLTTSSFIVNLVGSGNLVLLFGYSSILLSIYFFFQYVRLERIYYLIFSAIVFSFINHMAHFGFWLIIIFIGLLLFRVKINLNKILFIIIIFLIINLYWILPFLYGLIYANVMGANVSNEANAINALSQHSFLITSLAYNYLFNDNDLYSSIPFYFLIVIFLYVGINRFQIKFFLFALVLILIGSTFTTLSGPLGNIYKFFYENFSFFIVYREPHKFFLITSLGYSILIYLSVMYFFKKYTNKKITVFFIAIILIVSINIQSFDGSFKRVKLVSPPNEYFKFNNELNSENESYRLLSYPYMHWYGKYLWSITDTADIFNNITRTKNTNLFNSSIYPTLYDQEVFLNYLFFKKDKNLLFGILELSNIKKIIIEKNFDYTYYGTRVMKNDTLLDLVNYETCKFYDEKFIVCDFNTEAKLIYSPRNILFTDIGMKTINYSLYDTYLNLDYRKYFLEMEQIHNNDIKFDKLFTWLYKVKIDKLKNIDNDIPIVLKMSYVPGWVSIEKNNIYATINNLINQNFKKSLPANFANSNLFFLNSSESYLLFLPQLLILIGFSIATIGITIILFFSKQKHG